MGNGIHLRYQFRQMGIEAHCQCHFFYWQWEKWVMSHPHFQFLQKWAMGHTYMVDFFNNG